MRASWAAMKTYKALRTPDGCTVTVDGAPLASESASDFEWGYEGSGPQQLALAILTDHFGDSSRALTHHKVFMEVVLAELRSDEWNLTSEQIDNSFSQVVQVPMDLETLLNRARSIQLKQ